MLLSHHTTNAICLIFFLFNGKMRVYTTDRYYMRGRGGAYLADPDAYIRGRGIASLFGRIFSSVVPLVKGALNIGKKVAKSQVGRSLAKEVKRSATQAGINVVSDALKGKNILESSKKALAQAGENVGNKMDQLTNPISKAQTRPKTRRQKKKTTGRPSLKVNKRGGGWRNKFHRPASKKKKLMRKKKTRLSSLFD